MAAKDEYFCYRLNTKCEKCGKPTVTVGYSAPGKKETSQELLARWKKLYGGR